MSLFNKKHLIFLFVVFFAFGNKVYANIEINEVQISPTNERFIELYNSGSSDVTLTGYYIQRKTETGSNFSSLVSKTYFEGITIKTDSYLVISKTEDMNSDILVGNLTLTKSNSIQLKKSSNEIVDNLSWVDIPDNKSYQNIGGEWTISTPTPGEANSSGGDTSSGAEDNSSDLTYSLYTENDPEAIKITTKIISPKTVTTGIPFSIGSLTASNTGLTYSVGKYIWNLGDGRVIELGKSSPFDYTYEYSGEYVVTLSYYESILNEVADATSKMTIKVIPSGVTISSVGNGADPFIELENKSSYDVDLSKWTVIGENHYFNIPDGTIILPKKKIKLSPKITGFMGDDMESVNIMNPSKDIIATYPIKTKKVPQTLASNVSKSSTSQNNITLSNNNESKNQDFSRYTEVINLNDLSANAGDIKDVSRSTYALIGLFVVIGFGVASFWLVKKKGRNEEVEDYIEEGLEKEIRAEDMTIIE